jgi:YaaC-like Protein
MFRWEADDPTINGHIELLDRVAPGGTGHSPRWLRPGVGGVALSSLLTWWALLFGLSMLARYEPAGWAKVLDVESSELAVPLGQLLETALERVPELVIEALSAEPS